jgi:hypothetical protein
MSEQKFERAVVDWFEDGSDRTPQRAIDAVLLAVKTTPQERDLRIPWRFPRMLAVNRATGFAAVALVAVVGAGTLIYLNSPGTGGAGGKATPSPTLAVAPTASRPPVSTPQPSFVAPGITGWQTYTSAAYGYTISIPSDWSVYARATRKFHPGDTATAESAASDLFANPEAIDGDSMGLWVMQLPAPAGADLNSWAGLEAALREMCKPGFSRIACPTDDTFTPMCLGAQACQPAIITLVSGERTPDGVFGDPKTRIVTLFSIGRPDDFPAAARYGGAVSLLKSILSQVDVRAPQPGETPH